MAPPIITAYGATGHTGRLVAAELLARGQQIVVAGRDADGLRDLAVERGVPARVVPVDDPEGLRQMAAHG